MNSAFLFLPRFVRRSAGAVALSSMAVTSAAQAPAASAPVSAASVPGDSIAAVVNQEVITRLDVTRRIKRLEAELAARGQAQPSRDALSQAALERLIEERVQVSFAKEVGVGADDATVERAVASMAQQNGLRLPDFVRRVEREGGISFAAYREQLRDEIVISRLREREVLGRVRVSDAEVDDFLAEQSGVAAGDRIEVNIAQLLAKLPENPSEAQRAQARAKAERWLQQLNSGADFTKLSEAESEAPNAKIGGELGFRPASRLPQAFLESIKDLKPGQYAGPIQTGAGFHVLQVKARRQAEVPTVMVPLTRARHILLREDVPANRRLILDIRNRIISKQATFEQMAAQYSQDGSAQQGGDLGFVAPGQFVPEFEQVMSRLPLNQVSDPVPSRFGLHLIEVLERKEQAMSQKDLRERAREILRERKAEEDGAKWLADLRSRAFVEIRRD
jgi:peptidyl-prolyl cis-trans isomerase SurA